LASLKRGETEKKDSQMKTIPTTQPEANGLEAKGTAVGATISLLLLVAFGLSSYLNQQDKDISHAAAEHSNRPTVISAYLA
jgi:hypothetical protein